MAIDAKLQAIEARLGRAFKAGSSCSSGAASCRSDGTPEPRPHSSFLTTPASRTAGGRLTAHPSPSVLAGYERQLEAETGYAYRSKQLAAAAGGSAGGSCNSPTGAAPTMSSTQRDLCCFLQRRAGTGSSSQQSAAVGRHAQRPASAMAGLSFSSPAKGASLLEQSTTSRPGAPPADAPPFHRPASSAAGRAGPVAGHATSGCPAKLVTQEQLRQLSLDCSRTAARNTAALAASSKASALAARSASQPQDFRIAAILGSRSLPGGADCGGCVPPASATASVSTASTPVTARAAAAPAEDEDRHPLKLTVRLTPLFDAMPVPRQSNSSASTAATRLADQWSAPLGEQQQLKQQSAASLGSACSSPAGSSSSWRLAAGQAGTEGTAGTAMLLSRINELEAQLQLERMRRQEVAFASAERQEQQQLLQQQVHQQAVALEAARQQAVQAEAQAREAKQEAASLAGEVQRRRSVHSDSIDSITRVQAVSQVQRQELEELRQQAAQLNLAWEQENALATRLQHQLRDALVIADASEARTAERVAQAETQWEQRLQAVQQQAQEAQAELTRRCQALSDESLVQQQAAQLAAAAQAAAERRCAAAEARWRQQGAELDAAAADSEGHSQQLSAARQAAEEAAFAAAQLQQQLGEQQRRCLELEAAVAAERERSSSIAARADTAEIAQQGLGSHVKAAHTRLQALQEQLAAAQRECRQLLGEREDLQLAHASALSGLELDLSAAQQLLAEIEQERDQLRQRLAKTTAELEAQLQLSGQHRQQLAAAQQAEREAQAALERLEAANAQQAQQARSAEARQEVLESQLAQLECQLKEARQVAAAAEDRLFKASRNGSSASPLRDVVSGLRTEVQDKDLQLMQMHEDLARERSKAQELAQQMLNQALELDELQRDSSDTFGLRQQLAAAQQAEAQLRGELQQLRRQAAAAPGSGEGARSSPHGGGGGAVQGRSDRTAAELAAAKQEAERLREERDLVRHELEQRDGEVMQLQGQLVMLQEQVPDEGNWLAPLPDPYH